jgi:hypothetical protein
MILGLTLSPGKFRSILISPTPKQLTINTYTQDWQPIPVEIEHQGTIKYLGAIINANLLGKSALRAMSKHLEEEVARLRPRAAYAQTIKRYVEGALLPQLTYQGSFCTADLEHYEAMDAKLSSLFKEKLHLPQGFPNDVLFAPPDTGGLGVPKLSQACQLAKIRIFWRSIRSADTATRMALQGMLYRQVASANQLEESLFHLKTRDQPCWLNSILPLLAQDNISLVHKPSRLLATNAQVGDLYYNEDEDKASASMWELIGFIERELTLLQWTEPLYGHDSIARILSSEALHFETLARNGHTVSVRN